MKRLKLLCLLLAVGGRRRSARVRDVAGAGALPGRATLERWWPMSGARRPRGARPGNWALIIAGLIVPCDRAPTPAV